MQDNSHGPDGADEFGRPGLQEVHSPSAERGTPWTESHFGQVPPWQGAGEPAMVNGPIDAPPGFGQPGHDGNAWPHVPDSGWPPVPAGAWPPPATGWPPAPETWPADGRAPGEDWPPEVDEDGFAGPPPGSGHPQMSGPPGPAFGPPLGPAFGPPPDSAFGPGGGPPDPSMGTEPQIGPPPGAGPSQQHGGDGRPYYGEPGGPPVPPNPDGFPAGQWPQDPGGQDMPFMPDGGYGGGQGDWQGMSNGGPAMPEHLGDYPPPGQAPGAYHSQSMASPAAGTADPNSAVGYIAPPTAADFAQRRAHRPTEPDATMGIPAIIRKSTFGLVRPAPSRRERDHRQAVTMVRRNFGGLRQITVVNPKGGAGKTVAALMTAMTFGQQRGGYVLAWDNNETQGTLGMRAQPDFHNRTVRDLLADFAAFTTHGGRVGDLTSYVRAQGEAMFDVLASDESATAGEMLTARAFAAIRDVVSRFYKLIIVDTGNNVRAENWQASIDATDQLVVTMSARGDSAETAARMLDHLEQTGRDQLVRQAVSVVSMPASRKGLDLPAIQHHFAARTRGVFIAPYEPLLDSGEPIRYEMLSNASCRAWLRIAASIAEGL